MFAPSRAASLFKEKIDADGEEGENGESEIKILSAQKGPVLWASMIARFPRTRRDSKFLCAVSAIQRIQTSDSAVPTRKFMAFDKVNLAEKFALH
jgi:hypothetical protein